MRSSPHPSPESQTVPSRWPVRKGIPSECLIERSSATPKKGVARVPKDSLSTSDTDILNLLRKSENIHPCTTRLAGLATAGQLPTDPVSRHTIIEGTPGIQAIYGWCITSPTGSYISIQPFAEDLFRYITANGPMRPREPCGSRERS